MAKAVIVLLLLACALARPDGAPTVDESFDLFPQNGGTITVYGSGFTFDNLLQFNWILRAGGSVFESNPNIRTTGAVLPGGGDWFGCKPRTLVVNAPGTRVSCTMQWIPDSLIEGGGGVSTIELDVVNDNGFLATGPVVVAIVQNVDERVFTSTTNVVPNLLYGITVEGIGFPAFDSLETADTFELVLRDGPSVFTIDLIAAINDVTFDFYDDASFDPNPMLFGTRTNSALFLNANPQCTYDRGSIQCWNIPGGLDIEAAGTPSNQLTAEVRITSNDLSVMTFDGIGPAAIATIERSPGPPTLTPTPSIIDWSASEVTLLGSGFATYPSVQSNIVVFSAAGRGGEPRRCDVTSVNAAGTVLTCRLATSWNDGLGGIDPLEVWVMKSDQWTFHLDAMTPGPLPTQVAQIDYDYPPIEVTPNSDTVASDAQFMTITSRLGAFPIDTLVLYEDAVFDSPSATIPSEIQTSITLTGVDAMPVTCELRLPNWYDSVDAVAIPYNGQKTCTIHSMTREEIRINLPAITTDPGTNIGVDIVTTWASSGNSVTFPFAVVGVVGAGSGAGGDPHFVGILGTEYNFDGEVGHVYNMLSDKHVQMNAEIGKMYYSRPDQTIMKTIGIMVDGGDKLALDAGGNHLGTPGFTISLNGRVPRPSPNWNDTSLVHRFGNSGTMRWRPVTEDDDVRPGLWTKVEVLLDNYKISIMAIEQGRNADGTWHQQPVRFLDFIIDMFDPDRRPGGIFGQSAHPPPGSRRLGIEWDYEGVADDYETEDLFGTNFVFNQFEG